MVKQRSLAKLQSFISPSSMCTVSFQRLFRFNSKSLLFCLLLSALLCNHSFGIDEIIIDDFNDGQIDWTIIDITKLVESNGFIHGQTENSDARIVKNIEPDFDGSIYNILILKMYNEKVSMINNFEIYWANEHGGFSADRRVIKEIINDGNWHIYTIDLSENENWVGTTINRIRIDPQNASNDLKYFAIDYIRVVSQEKIWPMDSPDEITDVNQLNINFSSGALEGHTISPFVDPHFRLSDSTIHSMDYNTIEYQAKYNLDHGESQQCYFHTSEAGPVPITIHDETQVAHQDRIYTYYLGGHTEWKGLINWIRLDLAPGHSSSYDVRIPWIKLAYRLPPPLLLEPEDNHSTCYGDTPLLSWSMADDPLATLQVKSYEVQISHNKSFTDIVHEYLELSDTTLHADSLGTGVFFWRVRAIDLQNQPSAYTEKRKYTISDTTGGPDAPILSLPAHASTTLMKHPDFTWEKVQDGIGSYDPIPRGSIYIDHYEIQISTDSTFQIEELLNSHIIYSNRFVPNYELPEGYNWWRVRAVDNEGNKGAWSEVRFINIYYNELKPVYIIGNGASLTQARDILERAKATAPSIVRFASDGYYEWYPSGDHPQLDACLCLINYENMIIDGNGSTFIIKDKPLATFLYLRECTNLTLKNFTIDHDPLPYSLGKVTNVYENDFSFDFEVDDGYLMPGDPMLEDADHTWGYLLDPVVPGRLKTNAWTCYRTEIVSSLGNTCNLKLIDDHENRIDCIKEGDLFVRLARSHYANCLVKSKNITFDNFTIYSDDGQSFNLSYNESVNILNTKVAIKEGRRASIGGGGVYCRSQAVGPWMEGCLFEGQGDDAANIFAGPIYICDVKPDPHQLRLYGKQPNGNPLMETILLTAGDEVVIFTNGTGTINAIREVVDIEKEIFSNKYIVTLDGPVYDVIPGYDVENATVLFNLNRNGDSFVIRNNVFRNYRRLGPILRARNGVSEGNYFEGLSSSPFLIHNISFEGFTADNLMVVDNIAVGCGFERNTKFDRSTVELKLFKGDYSLSPAQEQKNINIIRNKFVDWQHRALQICCAQGVLIKGNTVNGSYESDFIFDTSDNYLFSLFNTANVHVLKNQFMDQRSIDGDYIIEDSYGHIVDWNKFPSDFIKE